MLTLKPVHKTDDLKKDDLIFITVRNGSAVARVDCIDGETIFLKAAHDNLMFRGNNGQYHKDTLSKILENHQILRICEE